MGDRIREPVGVAVGIAVRANRLQKQQAGYVRRSHAGAAVGIAQQFFCKMGFIFFRSSC